MAGKFSNIISKTTFKPNKKGGGVIYIRFKDKDIAKLVQMLMGGSKRTFGTKTVQKHVDNTSQQTELLSFLELVAGQ